MLSRWTGPGLFITSALPKAGKTTVAGAIAYSLNRQGLEVGVLKPVDPNCVRRREGLVSEDAEILAHRGDVHFPLDIICPLATHERLPRALTGGVIDWAPVRQSLDLMEHHVDVLVVEGTGGLMTPLDTKTTTLDVAKWLAIPVVITVRPGEEALSQMLLCVEVLRAAQLEIAGIVVNSYDPEKVSAADEKTLSVIERRTKTRLLAVLPQEQGGPDLGKGIADAAGKVDWAALAGMPVG